MHISICIYRCICSCMPLTTSLITLFRHIVSTCNTYDIACGLLLYDIHIISCMWPTSCCLLETSQASPCEHGAASLKTQNAARVL